MTLDGGKLEPDKVSAAKATTVTLDVALSSAYAAELTAGGTLDVTATVTYTNATGRTATEPLTVTLNRK